MLALFLLSTFSASPELMDAVKYHLISGDYQHVIEAEGDIYAATGFGLAVMSPDFIYLDHFPTENYSRRLGTYSNKLFLAEGNRIDIFKIKKTGPSLIGFIQLDYQVSALVAYKNHLAVTTDSATLYIYNLDNNQVIPEDTISLKNAANDICFYENYLYAACGHQGVAVIDLDDISDILYLETNGAQSLVVAEEKLYVATSSSKIYAFSVKEPSLPSLEKEFSSRSTTVDITYYDKHIYAAHGQSGYSIYNLKGQKIEGNQEFREGFVSSILATDDGVFLGVRDRGIVKLEGRTPKKLIITNRLEEGGVSKGVSNSGSFWGIAQGRMGVRILRMDADSVILGYANPRPVSAEGIKLSGTYAYVADSKRGVSIFSLKGFPSADEEFHLGQPGSPIRITLANDLIPVASLDKGLRVLWICPCGPLKQKQALEDSVIAVDVAAHDSLVYVADPQAGIRVIAMHDEPNDLELEQWALYPGVVNPKSLLLADDVLYVADSIGAIIALDVSNPAEPSQLSFTLIGTEPYRMTLRDKTLYVAAGLDGVVTLDITDPSAPIKGKTISTPGKALDVDASFGHLGIADYCSFVLIPVEALEEN